MPPDLTPHATPQDVQQREAAAEAQQADARQALQQAAEWEQNRSQEQASLEDTLREIQQDKAGAQRMLDAAHAERTSAEAVKKAIGTAESALDAREAKLKEAWRLLHSQVSGMMQGQQVQVGARRGLAGHSGILRACWHAGPSSRMDYMYVTLRLSCAASALPTPSSVALSVQCTCSCLRMT